MPAENDKDWIDHLSAAAKVVGLNPVRVRWKLIKWRDSWAKSKSKFGLRVQQVRYEHRICPSCGNIQDKSHKICDTCGMRLLPRALEMLRRCGILLPHFITPTTALISVIVFQYYRSAIYGQGNLMSPGSYSLIHFGANFPPYVWRGDWWRTATCIFLHGGAMHLIFNLMALKVIGPAVEEIFGKGRTLFFFMITGILAGIGSALLRDSGVGIGASGAIMGLVGLAAGWGQRDGGLAGRTVRDSMLQWGAYTLVFGFMVGADNVAHFVGLASGFALGVLARPARDKRLSTYVSFTESAAGIILFLVTLALCNFPPRNKFDVTVAEVSGARIIACGENSGLPEEEEIPAYGTQKELSHEGEPGFPRFSGDCKTIVAKLGGSFGIQVILEGTPPDGIAYLTVRLTHPPMRNSKTGTTSTVDEWDTQMDLGFPRYSGWRFDEEWEMVPGDWTIQLLEEVEEDEDENKNRILAEKTFSIQLAPLQ